jgi:protein phosphatase 2C family protein 2/3
MCVEGLDDAAGRLGFGDQEIDRRAGAAVRIYIPPVIRR